MACIDRAIPAALRQARVWLSRAGVTALERTQWLSLIRTTSGEKQLFAFTHGRGA